MIDLLTPIVGRIFAKVMNSTYCALDATSMPVLDVDHPLGLRTGTLWLLQGERVYSYFMYAESGHAHHLEKRRQGLQACERDVRRLSNEQLRRASWRRPRRL
jgi:hypothetical protein